MAIEETRKIKERLPKKKKGQWKLTSVKRWRELGFLVLPRHDREGEVATFARNYVDKLSVVDKVRGMLAIGRGPVEVARWIEKEVPTEATVGLVQARGYLSLYRRFFISPLDAVRATADMVSATGTGTLAAQQYRDRILGTTEKVKEITALERILDMQLERLEAARKNEKENLSGFLMQNIYKEMEVAVKTARELMDAKSELGVVGYFRVPKVIDINARVQVPDISQLSEVERESIKEFSDQFLELIKLSASEDEMSATEDGVFQVNGNGPAVNGKEP